jgi:urea transport system ATP-binding protein
MLKVKDINLYYGASHTLKSVSIKAEIGQITCILGRNGVGKTSLVRAIMGLQSIRSGSLTWQNKDITTLPIYERARHGIAFVPQGREIFNRLTVLENLKTGFAPLSPSERTIPERIFTLFPVLKDMLQRRGGDLSGGQQQQLAIARALVTRPKLLILDEPTEGIQPSIIKDIGRIIKTLADEREMAILLVEQYFDFAKELANDFVVMDRGEVVLNGNKDDLNETEVRQHLTV